jgi:hypothetical protein
MVTLYHNNTDYANKIDLTPILSGPDPNSFQIPFFCLTSKLFFHIFNSFRSGFLGPALLFAWRITMLPVTKHLKIVLHRSLQDIDCSVGSYKLDF